MPNCSGGNGPIFNNANLNPGVTHWYTGSGNSYNVNFGGGTLIICGNLTIPNINFNGASTIYIRPNASLVVGSSISFSGNAKIYNQGKLTVNGNLTLQGNNNELMNCSPASEMTVFGNCTVNSIGSDFVNFGTLLISGDLILQNGGGTPQLCLGEGSITSTTNFSSNNPQAIIAPHGLACLSYSNQALLNSSVTNDPNVGICQGPSSYISGNGNFGSATITSDCDECGILLPVELIDFQVDNENGRVQVSWSTASEVNNDHFIIQRGKSPFQLENRGQVAGVGTSTVQNDYVFYDDSPLDGISYYRLLQTDLDGAISYSDFVTVEFYQKAFSILDVIPNPVSDIVTVRIKRPEGQQVVWSVHDNLGKVVSPFEGQLLLEGENTITFDVNELKAGVYTVLLSSEDGLFVQEKIMVL